VVSAILYFVDVYLYQGCHRPGGSKGKLFSMPGKGEK